MNQSYDSAPAMNEPGERCTLQRRQFLKAAVTTTAALVVDADPISAGLRGALQGPGGEATPGSLGNAEPPAVQYQAYPGGTGALLEKLWTGTARPFGRTTTDIRPWQGPVPRDEANLAFLPVHRLAALVRERHVSSTELVEIYLSRLRRYDPQLLCAVTIMAGPARESAQQADAEIKAGRWRGPLHGIPYGLKDVFSVPGAPTTWGVGEFRTRRLGEDAAVAVKLRDAGAVLLAKLATGELARGDRWFRGRTRNPWNLAEGSSGSSAGPASATAAGCVAFGIGTETQGSIVSPARRCGLSALRPTFGRVSRHGGMVLAWSMDKVGPICRAVEDCALVFEAIHGADERDPASLTAPFAFTRSPDFEALRIGYMHDAPAAFLEALRDLGATLAPMPPLADESSHVLAVESAAAFDFRVAPDGEPSALPADLEPEERQRLSRFRVGRDIRAVDYVQSQRRRFVLMQEMARVMEGVDLFVSGTGLTRLTNQTGHPAVVVPYDFGPRPAGGDSSHPQPLTTTLIGDLFADDRVLSVAHAFQEATTWHVRRPPLAG